MPFLSVYETVLFDFDGTVCATGAGIMECTRRTLLSMGRPVPPPEILQKFIGPPPVESYQNFCGMGLSDAQEALRRFRASYKADGWRLSEPYPGIQELLKDLAKAGAKIATASSKPAGQIRRLLDHFGLLPYFTAVIGADERIEATVSVGKPALIREAMAACGIAGLQKTVMVGDTHFDGEGAKAVGIPFLGAAYGYGSDEELLASGASILARSVEALRPYLLKEA